jgi:hypothetical protein
VRTEPGGVVGNLVDVEDGDLAPAQGGHESDQQQGPVPGASHVRFRRTTTGLSPLDSGEAATTSTATAASTGPPARPGRAECGGCRATWRSPALRVGSYWFCNGCRIGSPTPAHGADLVAGLGQRGQVSGHRGRRRRQRMWRRGWRRVTRSLYWAASGAWQECRTGAEGLDAGQPMPCSYRWGTLATIYEYPPGLVSSRGENTGESKEAPGHPGQWDGRDHDREQAPASP